ncbi:hypothetical protein NV379_21390 [Paenibacillus sp. N1-5-1-14]|uniref:hypothetical protein n=1 Tax=Paenibacillus radicibacter TaxID=2972488 RepID=UPI002158D4F6|nr:hypothetical protein [Paenibacillus radicibacter]MCR8645213.1 hypothetical protein [Paenibacillus radicibacter]
MYIGNGSYCYANSASMLLKQVGEVVSPALLEVLTGVGLGVTMYGNGMLFLHNNAFDPDAGLSKAMKALGYHFQENWSDPEAECPLNELRNVLKISPAILGPIDMGYLRYAPNHQYAKGSDHYVLAYDMDGEYVYLHDPASFPYVRLALDQLDLTWKAADIPYGRGAYQYWHSIEKVNNPSDDEIYANSIRFFQHIYEQTGVIGASIGAKTGQDAITAFSEIIKRGEVTGATSGTLKYFVFQLGAKRANDFSLYFEKRNPKLARLKQQQSEILGLLHCLAVEENWTALADKLLEFGKLEEAFERELCGLSVLV